MALTNKLKAIADAIRDKTGKTEEMTLEQMATEILEIKTGGSGDEEWFHDGNTHIWVTLSEGRTSPMLGVGVNGTVTVDWGDGTTPDILTGTSTSTVVWTPTHNYAKPGGYVITLTVDGEMGFMGGSANNTYAYILRYSKDADIRNAVYRNAVRKIEMSNSVTRVGPNSFNACNALSSVIIPDSVKSFGNAIFNNCYSLRSVVIPNSMTSIANYSFFNCESLTSIVIPDSVTRIEYSAFKQCYTLKSIVIPNGVTRIENGTFSKCYSLSSVVIPDSVKSIETEAFNSCYSLSSVIIPNNVTSIGNNAFSECNTLTSIIIPDSVTSIGSNAFASCEGIRFYDFSTHTTIPTLSDTSVFTGISPDCEIRVPAALYDEWIAATNWVTYADRIVAV